MEWSESRYDNRNDKDESPVKEHRKKSDKEHWRRDRDQPNKASGDTEKDRGSRRERNRVEREKNRFNYRNSKEKDYDREKHRDRDKKDRRKDRDSEKKRVLEKDSDRVREKAKEREREKHRDREVRECNRDEHENGRLRDRGKRKTREEDYELANFDDKVNYHEKRYDDVCKHAKASKLNQDDEDGETSAYLSSKEHSLKMKETKTTKQSEVASEISSQANKSRKFEKERVLQLSKIFEEQDNIAVEGSDDEDKTHHLAGVKVLNGLDKVVESGSVVLTLRDQPILVDGDINEDADMLENVGIREQKRREDAYKAAKKKTSSLYDDKFNDVPSTEKKILPKYDDLAAEECLTLNERGRFSSEAEKKLEELKRGLTGVSTNNFEDLTSSRKVSSDYYSNEEMLQFKKPKKKKSFRKKDKLDITALEAEAVSSGLGAGDLGCRKDAKRQAIKDEQERWTTEMRNNAYRSAYAKADEASKLLRPEQSMYVKIGEDETPVFADDEEDLRKSLEKARRLTLKKHEEKGASGPQAIAILATSNPSNETIDDQTAARESRENKKVFTEMKEFAREMKKLVRGLHIDEDAREDEDVIMHDDEEANVSVKETKDGAGEWTEVKETQKDEQLNLKEKEEIVSYETIREVALGKGMFGALKLCKDQGTLIENIEWGGRNTDKKKSKLVGVLEDEGREAQNKKEIHIERTDEFGRTLTPKEAYRILSQKFHGVEPGKMKQEKRKKKFHEELKLKQMQSSDTPLLFAERIREVQACTKTPYVVLSGRVKPGQTSDPKSGFATVEKDLPGDLTPVLG